MSDEVREYLAQAQEEIKNLKTKLLKYLSERNVLQECVGMANDEIERLRAARAPDAGLAKLKAKLAEAMALLEGARICEHKEREGRDRAEKQLAEVEANASAMREALERIAAVRGDTCDSFTPLCRETVPLARAALAPGAGRALLAELEALRELETIVRSARAVVLDSNTDEPSFRLNRSFEHLDEVRKKNTP